MNSKNKAHIFNRSVEDAVNFITDFYFCMDGHPSQLANGDNQICETAGPTRDKQKIADNYLDTRSILSIPGVPKIQGAQNIAVSILVSMDCVSDILC